MSLLSQPNYSGKVRDVFKISDDTLMMIATDKISSFNKNKNKIDYNYNYFILIYYNSIYYDSIYL